MTTKMTFETAKQVLTDNGVTFTRKDYMDGVVDHQTYYGQFVNNQVISLICRAIGKDKILASTDKHFNDIPLRKWDALASSVPSRLVSLSNMFTQAEQNAVPSISLSDQVCILKAAAHQIAAR